MSSLFNASDREAIASRLSSLQPASARQWGKMDVAQMLAHCAVAFDVPCGDLVRKQAFMGRLIGPFVKKSLMSGKPMMRNAPAPPDFKVVNERDFAREHQRLSSKMVRFCKRGESACHGVVHPFFGAMTGDEWGRLMYSHLDHHLRQFSA